MFAKLFAGPLAFLYWIIGLWGFFLSVQVLHHHFGFLGVLVGVLIAPVSFIFAPLYAGFVDNYWLPAIVSYTPIAVMMLLSLVAQMAGR